jgi:fumarate reductase subunit D
MQKGATFAAAFLLILLAVAFLGWSAYQGLATRFDPWAAALIVGLAFAVLALLVLQFGQSLGRPAPLHHAAHGLKADEVANKVEHELDNLVGPQLARVISRNAKSATLAAIGLGLVAGRSKEVRHTLLQALQELNKPPQ